MVDGVRHPRCRFPIRHSPSAIPHVQAPLVLHVRVVAGAGGGPDKTILRSAAHTDLARYRVAAAYIHPNGDPGMNVMREQAKQWNCPLWGRSPRAALTDHAHGAITCVQLSPQAAASRSGTGTITNPTYSAWSSAASGR